MHAVLLTGHGGLDKLEYRTDVPVPSPKNNEVLIRVAAAGVNNTDINTRIGWYSKSVTSDTNKGSEKGLTELTRDLRSAIKIIVPKIYKPYPMNFSSAVFVNFLTPFSDVFKIYFSNSFSFLI